MSEINAYGNNFVMLIDEDGREVEFEHIGTLDLDEQTYMAFIPGAQALTEQAEITILKTQMDGDEEILVSLTDEEELSRVYREFMSILSEEYDVGDVVDPMLH